MSARPATPAHRRQISTGEVLPIEVGVKPNKRPGIPFRASFVLLILVLLTSVWVGTQVFAHGLRDAGWLGETFYPIVPRPGQPTPASWELNFPHESRAKLYLLSGVLGCFGLLLLIAPSVSPGMGHMKDKQKAAPLMLFMAAVFYGLTLGKLYFPHQIFTWVTEFDPARMTDPAEQAFYGALFGRAYLSMGGTLVFGLVAVFSLRRGTDRAFTGSHGTSGWSTGKTLQKAEHLLLGRLLNQKINPKSKPKGEPRARSKAVADSPYIIGEGQGLLRAPRDGHILTVAPTRSGKGVGAIIPNLLDYPGSMIVTDPKGENYAVTAWKRRQIPGHQVYAFDPFGLLQTLYPEVRVAEVRALADGSPADLTARDQAFYPKELSRFNPMDLIDGTSRSASDDAMMLAEMLVVTPPGGAGQNQFFYDEARALLATLILYVATTARLDPVDRTLDTMRGYLSKDKDGFQALLKEMQTERDPTGSPLANGLVARGANLIQQKDPKELSGVVSTAASSTHFLNSLDLCAHMQRSSFDMRTIKQASFTIYLIIPVDKLSTYNRWLRLVIGSLMTALVKAPGKPKYQIQFILDEFANLGTMDLVTQAVSLLAGLGANFWIFLQDLSQLKALYGDRWETYMENSEVKQFFGVSGHFTAEYVSKMLGDATIWVESANESKGTSGGKSSTSAAETVSEKARKLLNPDEVMRLNDHEQILIPKGSKPIRCRKLKYYEDPEFARMFKENPMNIQVAHPAPPTPGVASSTTDSGHGSQVARALSNAFTDRTGALVGPSATSSALDSPHPPSVLSLPVDGSAIRAPVLPAERPVVTDAAAMVHGFDLDGDFTAPMTAIGPPSLTPGYTPDTLPFDLRLSPGEAPF